MKTFSLALLISLLVLGSNARADIFFFGDSLTDSGNLFNAIGTPSAPYFNGRFSNGPTWAENFAQRMGMSAVASTSGGTNYAYGGARTGTGFVPSLLTQVGNYETAGAPGNADDLFVIWAGSNDVFDAAESTDPLNVVDSAVQNISGAIASLEATGAENFLVLNAVPLGETPFYQPLGNDTVSLLNSLSVSFNDGLSNELMMLESSLGIEVTEVEMFDLIADVQMDPTRFGLINAVDSATPFDATTGLATGLPTVDPETYLFWDGTHPTAAGHRLIANHVFSVAVPEPSGLLLTMILGSVISIRRSRRSA